MDMLSRCAEAVSSILRKAMLQMKSHLDILEMTERLGQNV